MLNPVSHAAEFKLVDGSTLSIERLGDAVVMQVSDNGVPVWTGGLKADVSALGASDAIRRAADEE